MQNCLLKEINLEKLKFVLFFYYLLNPNRAEIFSHLIHAGGGMGGHI